MEFTATLTLEKTSKRQIHISTGNNQPVQVTRNRYAQTWLLGSLQDWVELHLIAHSNVKVNVTIVLDIF